MYFHFLIPILNFKYCQSFQAFLVFDDGPEYLKIIIVKIHFNTFPFRFHPPLSNDAYMVVKECIFHTFLLFVQEQSTYSLNHNIFTLTFLIRLS